MNFPTSAAFAHYAPAACVRVGGPDAATFLQGQFSNDLRPLPSAPAVYGLWLDVKGRVIADSYVCDGPPKDEFLLFSVHSPAAALLRRLEDFVIADDVTVEDQTSQWVGFALVGEGSGAWLAAEARLGRFFPGRRGAQESWEWLVPRDAAAACRAGLTGARELSEEELERIRIRAGIASVPADIGPKDLPNEGGLERDAVAYDKGCYLGQEVMMRLRTRGRVRRKLARVQGEGALPAVPAPLWHGARVGELRSAVAHESGLEAGTSWIGLALLPAADPGPFSLQPAGSPSVALVNG